MSRHAFSIQMGNVSMRDDTERWREPRIAREHEISRERVMLRRIFPGRQTLISGPRAAAMTLAAASGVVAWPDIATGEAFSLSLRRDRLLAINGGPFTMGWNAAEGLAISDMTSGYSVFELSGQGAMGVLATGTEIALGQPSASTLRLWHGFGIILYRYCEAERYRIHVGAGFTEAFFETILAQISALEG